MYILDDHDQEGELDSEGLTGIHRACDERSCYISPHDLKDWRLNILIS